jgi:ribosome-associated toxin RatA of RatAB toxin-antitoxin module
MFEIVKNVDSYCYFLPGCSRSKTFNHKPNYFEGELEIDYKLFKSSYISKVSI